MKKSKRMGKTGMILIVVITLLLPLALIAGEILSESGWKRLISGDKATWLTRELDLTPVPAVVPSGTIAVILKSTGLSDLNEKYLIAWQSGLQRWGWVQQENEPEYEPYQVIRLVLIKDQQVQILQQQFDLYGKISEAVYDLKGSLLKKQHIEIAPSLDRSVFHTTRSPALFVLNQEHFQRQFFEEMLNLDFPGLEGAKEAYTQRKILLAAHEVAEYFRRKIHPVWKQKLPEQREDKNLAAEKVLRHEFAYHDSTIYLGERIDYRNNPTEDNEWIWGLNRMGHWNTLLTGYLGTANEKYSQEYNSQVLDWTVRNPAPPFRLTRTPSWRNLEAGIRMSETWPRTFFGFLSSPSFQTQTIQLMLASMWSHGQHIQRFPSGMRFVNNWVIIGSNGLAVLGMSYPEFRDAPAWASTGLSRLSDQLDKQVYADGMQHELASGYHLACMHSFTQAYEVAKQTNTPIPDNFHRTLERMFNYVMYISTPSHQLPPTNDSNRLDITGWMKKGALLFDRSDMLYFATDGAEGRAPEKTSVQFGWGGQSVMRSGWDREALYLFFDAGPAGVSHQHEDKLHIDVSAYGRDFLTDGGKGLYIPDKWRDYFLSTRAHNTIMIDGQEQIRIPDSGTHRTDKPMFRQWLSNEVIDFASGDFKDGYGAQHIPVTHTRYVVFKKHEYWLVLDILHGEGEHAFEALYHFTPSEISVDQAQKSFRTHFNDGRNLQLRAAATLPLSLQIIRGAENPEQGWIYANDERIAAATAVYSGKSKLPVQFVTLIEATNIDQFALDGIEIVDISAEQGHLRIEGQQGVDDWLINLKKENRLKDNGEIREDCIRFYRTKNDKILEQHTFRFED